MLLPKGWSLKPAGRQAPLDDFPILIAECPTEPVLAVLQHAGYGEHEVITLDAASGKTIARYALPVTFGDLAWTRDGKALFVGGGTDDVIDRFDHPGGGLLARRTTIPYPGGKKGVRLPAGLALSGDGTTLWVANAFGHSVARFDAATGELKTEVGTGADSYP